ncbi:hypothetical protein PIB30_001484 [Stylosanthes scabra]|uniref:Uncharacterized protein n=1 Tax=Stylosanthes scabra TaxID=79078 RepID=A0ABU6Q2J9_9FABA|nr:hypothetical protein [Stylosanthes scabra]
MVAAPPTQIHTCNRRFCQCCVNVHNPSSSLSRAASSVSIDGADGYSTYALHRHPVIFLCCLGFLYAVPREDRHKQRQWRRDSWGNSMALSHSATDNPALRCFSVASNDHERSHFSLAIVALFSTLLPVSSTASSSNSDTLSAVYGIVAARITIGSRYGHAGGGRDIAASFAGLRPVVSPFSFATAWWTIASTSAGFSVSIAISSKSNNVFSSSVHSASECILIESEAVCI